MQERREFPRRDTGGTAEIVSVLGGGTPPEERALVLNCSRGGLLLRVKSPRRRMLRPLDPCLRRKDTVTAVLRVPPEFQDIDVLGEVVRVDRASDDPEFLHVGLRFFWDAQRQSGLHGHFEALGRILEPRKSRRLTPPEGVAAARPGSGSGRNDAARSARLERPRGSSGRLEQRSSARLEKATSGRQERTGSDRQERGRSERTRPPVTPPVAEDSAAVLAELGAMTLEQSDAPARTPAAPATPAPAPASEAQGLAAWARARISDERPAVAAAAREAPSGAPAVYTGLVGPELGLYARGSARLQDGAAVFELPGHFTAQADPATLTVHLTPTEDCRGLYVVRTNATKVAVRELAGGKSQASFSWLALAARRA